jgi:hypothetical protein
MTTIRRLYAYLLAFAGLAMLAVGAANLGQVLVDVLLHAPLASGAGYVRDTVSLNAAAVLVGLPVWLVHWLWVERSVRRDDAERSSTLRRLYLYIVLAAAMGVMGFSAHSALSSAFDVLQRGSSVDAVLRELPFLGMGLVVWLAHWRIAARDRALVGESGGSATLRRWYLYGAAFVGLLTLLVGASDLLEALWRMATSSTAGLVPAESIASTLVGGAVWLLHWSVLPRRLTERAQREDGVSTLRSVYLFLALSVGVIGTLAGASQLLYYAVGRLLGVDRPGGVGGDLLQAAAGPVSVGIVYGVVWAYQRQALRRQAATFDEAPRQAGIRRLYTYTVALIALGVLATGVAGLLWTLGDVVFNTAAASTGEGWRGNVALFATLAIVGLPVWLLHWRPRPEAEDEVRSLARRLYLYVSLIVAMLAVVGSGAAALYRVINLLLGETSSVSLLSDLAHALAVVVVAGSVAIYHLRVLRADSRRVSPPTPAEAPAAAEVVLKLRAADATTLERALDTLRGTGVEIVLLGSVEPERRPGLTCDPPSQSAAE